METLASAHIIALDPATGVLKNLIVGTAVILREININSNYLKTLAQLLKIILLNCQMKALPYLLQLLLIH